MPRQEREQELRKQLMELKDMEDAWPLKASRSDDWDLVFDL